MLAGTRHAPIQNKSKKKNRNSRKRGKSRNREMGGTKEKVGIETGTDIWTRVKAGARTD